MLFFVFVFKLVCGILDCLCHFLWCGSHQTGKGPGGSTDDTLILYILLYFYIILVYMYVYVFISFDYVNVMLPGHVQLFLLLIAFGFQCRSIYHLWCSPVVYNPFISADIRFLAYVVL